MSGTESTTVWDRLREYATTQSGTFTSQEALSWFRRHSPSQANERTVRTHIRGACWNVGDRSQFARKEPFLTRIDRGEFRLATVDEIDQWRQGRDVQHSDIAPASSVAQVSDQSPTAAATPHAHANPSSGDWHTEANVQALLVTALATDGWRIISVANTATKEHGIDVIASKEGETVGVEVKGFPSRTYADPARSSETKRSSPSTQTSHWYSQAVLAAMRLRGKEPAWRSVIAFPDFPRYRDLHDQTRGSLEAAGIEVWWINEAGLIDRG